MQMTAQAVFKELQAGKVRPVYLIVGEEPFQIDEITSRIRSHFVKDEAEAEFNSDRFDGESFSVSDFASALDTLPGLFADGPSCRVVTCRNFERAADLVSDVVERHVSAEGEPSACLVLVAAKVDKRKGWYRSIDGKGAVLEVTEPAEREWQRWQAYLESKAGKRIDADAWAALVESSGRKLAVLWSELAKIAAYVGASDRIRLEDVQALAVGAADGNVFSFVDDVVCGRKYPAIARYRALVDSGENDIKMLAIVAKQFRLIWQCLNLPPGTGGDPKALASRLGAHPYFLSKVLAQAKGHSPASVARAIRLIAEADYQLKSGGGDLLAEFLLPYFSEAKSAFEK